jgi:serine/threonine protein kinase
MFEVRLTNRLSVLSALHQTMLAPGTRLKERYRILHQVGGGGFGYVYKALDEVFGCSVAIKETREEVSQWDKLRKAVEREAKLLRNLKHTSLPRVTDYFFQDQAQFLVMDFVEGEDLATQLMKRLRQNQEPFNCQELLPLANKILAALEYLHNCPEPIIHCDIKPANIKLTDEGEVYLLDFGLAKGAFGQMSTIIEGKPTSGMPGCTPEYAPLEQLQGTGTGPESDIYSLGATLYHLLTGHLPVPSSQRDEALQRGESDPLRPACEVNPSIPLEVSQIISHALALRKWNRFGSAKEMRAALERACGEAGGARAGMTARSVPQLAQPGAKDQHSTLPLQPPPEPALPAHVNSAPSPATPARWRQLGRPWLIAGLAFLSLSILITVAVYAFPYLFPPTVTKKSAPPVTPPMAPPKSPVASTPANLTPKPPLKGHSGAVWSVAFSLDGGLAASAGEDKTIILWDTQTWTPKFPSLTGHTGAVYSITFSPREKILASGSDDKTIKLWDTQTGYLIRTLPSEDDRPVLRLAFSPDGNFLASCSGQEPRHKEIRLWHVRDGWKSRLLEGHEDAVLALAFAPEGDTLASAGHDGQLRLWELRSGRGSEVLKEYDQKLLALAFSDDGKYMACGSSDNTIKLWSYQPQTRSWKEQEPLKAHKGFITAIAFSPDNKTLASSSADGTIRLWDVVPGTSTPRSVSQGEVQSRPSKGRLVGTFNSVVFSPDGQTLLTGGQDTMVRVWQ